MKKAILAQKVLASVLTIGLGGFVLPLAAQANSGLSDDIVQIKSNKFYVGSNGAENNVVVIDSDLPEQAYGVIGGYAEKETAVNNRVTVSECTINGSVYGGFVTHDKNVIKTEANQNSVNIRASIIEGIVFGGYVYYDPNDPSSIYWDKGNANNNFVNISGSTMKKDVYGGYAPDNTIGNVVNISNSTVVGSVYGGQAFGDNTTNNTVNISGSTVTGGNYGGSGSTITGGIYGGKGLKNVSDNKVIISGGKIVGIITGGYIEDSGESTGRSAERNSIILSGMVDVSKAEIYGGVDFYCDGSNIKDNKLIINGWSGTVGSLHNFNGDNGGIEVKAIGGGLDLAVGKTTNFITATGLEDGDKIIYIKDSEIQKNSKQVENIQAGVALIVSGEIGISDDNKNIYINSTSVRINDQTAITTESRAAAAAFVNQGAEAVSDSINSLQGAEAGISTFATVSGNNSKYDTGSYVDINGWNGIVGVAKTKNLNAGKFSYGAFFENGGGNYNTYNDFNGTSFRGDGNVVYNGGGLLMRYEQENGVYTEASLRAGTAKNEVSNALEFTGNRYGFKTENAYYGAHIGIGKIIKLDNGKAWDIYGKYFHTHHEGDSVKIANDVFDFDSVDSDKLCIGARFSEQQGEKLTSYYGLAWEYEFSGDAGGTANHYAMYTPSLEGSTVIGEVGFCYTPGKASPWYFDANVKGYAGMQEGISGSVQAVYSF